MFSARKNKITQIRLTDVRSEDVDLLPDDSFIRWIERKTLWGYDFDPEADIDQMRRVWEAECVPDQDWRVTTKRRRKTSNGIQKREEVFIHKLSQFPSHGRLEEIVEAEGFGGGEYIVSSTKRIKVKHRIVLDGPPEDPYLSPSETRTQQTEPVDRKEENRAAFIEIGMQYLQQNPEVGRIVALKIIGKELGISIPLPPMPDPSAPVPYAELSAEEQDWLEEHPADKEFYLRRELGLEPPEPTFEEDAVERIKEKLLERIAEDVVSGSRGSSSVAAEIVSALLENPSLEKVIPEVAKLWKTPGNDGDSAGEEVRDALDG